MHVDSKLSANIQLADWIATYVARAIDYQLLADSPHYWTLELWHKYPPKGKPFTFESKLHLNGRSVPDLNHIELLRFDKRVAPKIDSLPKQTRDILQKMHAQTSANRT